MASSQTPASNDFARWVEEKSEAVMADLSERFPPATSGPQAVHAENQSVPSGHAPEQHAEVATGVEEPGGRSVRRITADEIDLDDTLVGLPLLPGGRDGHAHRDQASADIGSG